MKDDQRIKWDQLSPYVQGLMEAHNVPGVSIGIIKSGELFSDGFGVTSVENPLPVTNSTLFQIGSITKTFTCTAIVRLAEMGKLELDAPIQTYYPDFKVGDKGTSSKATIRHLLTHTSGWLGDFFIDTGSGDDAMATYAERMVELDQISPAGSIVSYNNSGFYLLGYIIELCTKTSYEEAIRELVIDPLGLEKCLFNPGDVMLNRFSVGHRVMDGVAEVANPWALPRAAYPAGGLVCNVGGLLKFARFHLEGGVTSDGERVLETATTEMMQVPQDNIWGDEEFIGLSWFITIENGTKIISHSGGTVGQGAILQFVPDHEINIAILTNADTGAQLIASTIKWCLREYAGIESEDPKPLNVPLDKKTECEGRYVLPRLGYVDIHLRGERLIAEEVPTGGFPTEDTPPAPARPPYTLAFIEEDRLVVIDGKSKGEKVELIRDATGEIKWLRKGSRLHIKESIGE
jgi:CubicO group peptidase (beta-lactamase class C family)